MATLAKLTEQVVHNVAARRDPETMMEVTNQEVNDILDFFADSLVQLRANPYLLNLFAELRHKVQRREVTINAIRTAMEEYKALANSSADTLATVSEQLAALQFTNRDLRAELRAAIAQSAENEESFYDQGRDSVVWIWADLVAQDAGITIDEALEEIIRHIVNAENPVEVESDDAA